MEIMRSIPGWDQYYLDICKVVSARSKDPNTQIGCVIIGPNHEIRSTGYNSFPRGIRDDVPERLVRPAKYLWIEHAERNAICNAARAGTATEGCTIFVEIMPMVWDELEQALEKNETITGRISGKVKGGFTVDIKDVRAFLPGSLVDVRPVRDPGT